jgi:hypothetical protein
VKAVKLLTNKAQLTNSILKKHAKQDAKADKHRAADAAVKTAKAHRVALLPVETAAILAVPHPHQEADAAVHQVVLLRETKVVHRVAARVALHLVIAEAINKPLKPNQEKIKGMTKNEEREDEYSSKVPAGYGGKEDDDDRMNTSGKVNDPRHSPDITPCDSHEEISD